MYIKNTLLACGEIYLNVNLRFRLETKIHEIAEILDHE